jgi:hypothetical protein
MKDLYMKKIVTMCDPPSGWKYGFPKVIPEHARDSSESYFDWLVSEGYPQKLIDDLGDRFCSRYWNEEIEEKEE